MAYTQNPTPFKQEKKLSENLKKTIESNTQKNKRLNEVESFSKTDSVTAAKKRLSLGGTKEQAQLQGNLAANKTRQLNNAWNLTVDRGSRYGGGYPLPNITTYDRRKPTVEQDVKMETNSAGELDVAKPKKKPAVRQMKSKTKTPPLKQMETIKKIGSKIVSKIAEGGKWLADAAEGKKGTANYSGSDETARQKNTGSAKNKKTPKTNESVAKMKKC